LPCLAAACTDDDPIRVVERVEEVEGVSAVVWMYSRIWEDYEKVEGW
jgi:hypothetical protein